MDDSIKISDQVTAIYLLSLKNEGLLQIVGSTFENNRLTLEFSPKGKALFELQKMENLQAQPMQPKKLLDGLAEFKNILRRVRNQL